MESATTKRSTRPSLDDYFAAERSSSTRHEYYADRIVAMAGGSISHGTIVSNLNRALGNALDGRPCRVFTSDQRVKSEALGRFFYPDSFALCGAINISKDDGVDSVTNPQLIVEVLSPSTFNADHNAKFDAYSTIESLTEYVLVEQAEARVSILRRQPGGPWVFANVVGLDGSAKFDSVGIEIPLKAIYRDVVFGSDAANNDSNLT